MAQPIRNNGWLPFTSRSNARGTSGTRPGNRWAMSAGGVPIVSDARHTTTPPVSLNFAEFSHGVRAGAASRNRWGQAAPRLLACGLALDDVLVTGPNRHACIVSARGAPAILAAFPNRAGPFHQPVAEYHQRRVRLRADRTDSVMPVGHVFGGASQLGCPQRTFA